LKFRQCRTALPASIVTFAAVNARCLFQLDDKRLLRADSPARHDMRAAKSLGSLHRDDQEGLAGIRRLSRDAASGFEARLGS
jgi:hypothetical protein